MIRDSISNDNIRVCSIECYYPAFIHGEVMTHRVFSRNASSTRAIPVERMIQFILDDTAMPVSWGKNQKGMQAAGEHNELIYVSSAFGDGGWPQKDNERYLETPSGAWLAARNAAIHYARAFDMAGYHKQVVNRLLMPFMHMRVLITSTDWDNFFELRCHPDADPTMQALAYAMKAAMDASKPQYLLRGQWHLPYVTDDEYGQLRAATNADGLKKAIQTSVARCARTSYKTHDGETATIEQEVALYNKLLAARPLHASPAEHQCTPDWLDDVGDWKHPELHGNFRGMIQYRKTIE